MTRNEKGAPSRYRCPVCGEDFTATRPNAKTCSSRCRQQLYRDRKAPSVMSVVHGTNATLIARAAKLHLSAGARVADVTWGRGMFWTKLTRPDVTVLGSDISPRSGAVMAADFRQLPYADASLDIVVLDPPYMAKPDRAAKYKLEVQYNNIATTSGLDHDGIIALYADGMREAVRVLKPGGLLWVKCKDEIAGRQQRRSHIEVHEISRALGLIDLDKGTLVANSGGPNGRRGGKQKHFRKRESILWIFAKRTRATLRMVA